MSTHSYLRIGKIEGESLHVAHRGEIEIIDWKWGLSAPIELSTGQYSGRIRLQTLMLEKLVDASSNALLKSFCEMVTFDKADLSIRRESAQPCDYMILAMENVRLLSLNQGGKLNEPKATESLELWFTKFTFKYQPTDQAGGKKGGCREYVYDLNANIAR